MAALLTDCGDGWYIWCVIFGIYRAYKEDKSVMQDFCSFDRALDFVKKQKGEID